METISVNNKEYNLEEKDVALIKAIQALTNEIRKARSK